MTRQASTAIAVYRTDIQPTVSARQAIVLRLLGAYHASRGTWPTAQELLRYAITHDGRAGWDVNAVRPRLSELVAAGSVTVGDARSCAVSGKRVRTWVLCDTPAQPTVVAPARPARQLGLL